MANISASMIEAVITFVAGLVGTLIAFRKPLRASSPLIRKIRKLLRWTAPILVALGIVRFVTNLSTPEPVHAETIITGMKSKMVLPLQVDDDTRLDDVRAMSAEEIGYFLTLTKVSKAQLVENSIAQQLVSNVRSGACQNPDYVKLFEAGISLRVAYQTFDHVEVVQIVLAPEDCGF